jgi:putative transposase
VISARKHGDRDLSDERILGDADFVAQVIKKADDRLSSQFEGLARKQETQEIIQKICDQENINVLELKAGSRRRSVCRARSQVAHGPIETYGIPLAEVALHGGVCTSALSKMVRKE